MCLGSLGEIEQSEIDQRLQLPGAQWLPRNVPQMLALCCRCLSDQLDLQSLPRR
jgi:hypothetical protein